MDNHAQEKTGQNTTKRHSLRKEVANLRKECAVLQTNLSLANDELSRTKDKLSRTEDELSRTKDELSRANDTIAKLRKSNSGMKEILDELGIRAADQAKISFEGEDFIEEVGAEQDFAETGTN